MPPAKKSAEPSELFEYTAPSGVKVTLNPLPPLTNGDIRPLRRLSVYDQTCTLVEKYCTDEQIEQFDKVRLDETADLKDAWMKFSEDVSLGE